MHRNTELYVKPAVVTVIFPKFISGKERRTAKEDTSCRLRIKTKPNVKNYFKKIPTKVLAAQAVHIQFIHYIYTLLHHSPFSNNVFMELHWMERNVQSIQAVYVLSSANDCPFILVRVAISWLYAIIYISNPIW